MKPSATSRDAPAETFYVLNCPNRLVIMTGPFSYKTHFLGITSYVLENVVVMTEGSIAVAVSDGNDICSKLISASKKQVIEEMKARSLLL